MGERRRGRTEERKVPRRVREEEGLVLQGGVDGGSFDGSFGGGNTTTNGISSISTGTGTTNEGAAVPRPGVTIIYLSQITWTSVHGLARSTKNRIASRIRFPLEEKIGGKRDAFPSVFAALCQSKE
uniref:Uncharacterized protein n=1 Tax=Vespula pensylvanica TaxID=30213 RepID=A0A834UI55_VESPE|nr:hypothetical protein H0235_002029 [Vespula pensylvanica]